MDRSVPTNALLSEREFGGKSKHKNVPNNHRRRTKDNNSQLADINSSYCFKNKRKNNYQLEGGVSKTSSRYSGDSRAVVNYEKHSNGRSMFVKSRAKLSNSQGDERFNETDIDTEVGLKPCKETFRTFEKRDGMRKTENYRRGLEKPRQNDQKGEQNTVSSCKRSYSDKRLKSELDCRRNSRNVAVDAYKSEEDSCIEARDMKIRGESRRLKKRSYTDYDCLPTKPKSRCTAIDHGSRITKSSEKHPFRISSVYSINREEFETLGRPNNECFERSENRLPQERRISFQSSTDVAVKDQDCSTFTYACPECEQTYRDAWLFSDHLSTHSVNANDEDVSIIEISERRPLPKLKQKFECYICAKAFLYHSSLQMHMYFHASQYSSNVSGNGNLRSGDMPPSNADYMYDPYCLDLTIGTSQGLYATNMNVSLRKNASDIIAHPPGVLQKLTDLDNNYKTAENASSYNQARITELRTKLETENQRCKQLKNESWVGKTNKYVKTNKELPARHVTVEDQQDLPVLRNQSLQQDTCYALGETLLPKVGSSRRFARRSHLDSTRNSTCFKSHKCVICTDVFSSPQQLGTHLRVGLHGDCSKLDEDTLRNSKCMFCPKIYLKRSRLNKHIKTHKKQSLNA